MTEDEAKTKWCPHVKYVTNNPRCMCIASDCMMWVSNEEYTDLEIEDGGKTLYGGLCGLTK